MYLPKSWTAEPDRCRAAGVPDDIKFATKPTLAREMITRALDAGIPASWVAGDEVYGADSKLRASLQERRIGYVLAVACDHQVTALAGKHLARALARRLPSRAWSRLSAGVGAKGQRWYDWALIDITDTEAGGGHGLLVRRSISSGELAFYRCYTPTPVPLATLVAVADRRWTIEESFQAGKGLTGLDEHQVRRWTSWHRWTILAMFAHAFLAVTAATERAEIDPTPGLIPLTANEIRHGRIGRDGWVEALSASLLSVPPGLSLPSGTRDWASRQSGQRHCRQVRPLRCGDGNYGAGVQWCVLGGRSR